MTDLCMYCLSNMHFLCQNDDECCCGGVTPNLNLTDDLIDKRPVGRPMKGEGYENQLSAGRKYASRKYPIELDSICEWAWKGNAGGGVKPIMGCTGRKATNIHHGPDKSTLNNNRETNISHVCSNCHNLWHSRNDRYYPLPRPEDGKPWLPKEEYTELKDAYETELKENITQEFELGRDSGNLPERKMIEEAKREG